MSENVSIISLWRQKMFWFDAIEWMVFDLFATFRGKKIRKQKGSSREKKKIRGGKNEIVQHRSQTNHCKHCFFPFFGPCIIFQFISIVDFSSLKLFPHIRSAWWNKIAFLLGVCVQFRIRTNLAFLIFVNFRDGLKVNSPIRRRKHYVFPFFSAKSSDN